MSKIEKYIAHLESSFDKAENNISKLPEKILEMDGMSGKKTRHFYNNLLELEDARWLEIGIWKGSSSCAAMYGNKATCLFIENWAGFGGPREIFLQNFDKYKGENDAVIIEQDCFKIDTNTINTKFNIYCFDADHSEHSTFMGVEHYLPVLDDVFILIMDDWNMDTVRSGTEMAIEKHRLETLWSKEIRLTQDNTHTEPLEAKETWHNGTCVYLLQKNLKDEIQAKYEELCRTPSDINEHLKILREYADKCDTVVEMGVRGCVSLYAFLSSKAKKVTAIDILNVWTPDIPKLTFICADDLTIEIENTDMLFVDSKHTYNQLKQELALHSKNVNKYIGMHDTGIFGRNSDDGTVKGLMDALEEFLVENKEWSICYTTSKNNGLTIIKRN